MALQIVDTTSPDTLALNLAHDTGDGYASLWQDAARRSPGIQGKGAELDRAAAGLEAVVELLARDQRHRADAQSDTGVTYVGLTPADLEGLHCAVRSLSRMVATSVDGLREAIAREQGRAR